MIYAENFIFDVFTLTMTDGSPRSALTAPHTVVITEDMARKCFNSVNAVGNVLTVNDSIQYKVVGVIKNIPKESHFHFDFFISMATIGDAKESSWFSNIFHTYILFKPGTNPKTIAGKMPEFMIKHAGAELQAILHMDFKPLEKTEAI